MTRKRIEIDVDVDVGRGPRELEELRDAAGSADDALADVEQSGKSMARGISQSAGAAADDLDDVGQAGKDLARGISRSAGDAADDLDDVGDAAQDVDNALSDAGDAGKELDEISTEASKADEALDETSAAADRLDQALGDVDADTADVVDELDDVVDKTSEATDEAGDLKRSLEKVDDVDLSGAGGEVDGVSGKMDGVSESSDRARGAVTGFGGGVIGEMPGVAGAIGPVGEGLGQIAEGAAEGEINIKHLAAAGAGMVAVGFILSKVTGHLEKLKAIDAFKEEQVDEYAEALHDAAGAVDAVLKKITEAGSVEFMNEWAGEVDDLDQALAQANVTGQQFAQMTEWSDEKLRDWAATTIDAGVSAFEVAKILQAVGQNTETTTDALSEYNAEMFVHGGRSREQTKVLQQMLYWQEKEEQALADIEDAAADAGEEIDDLTDDFSELQDQMSDRSAYLGIKDEFDRVKAAGDEAMTAVKDGTADADSKLREYEQSQISLKNEVIDYATEVGNIPRSTVSEILAYIDQGKLAEAQAALDDLERTRTATLRVRINQEGGVTLPSGTKVYDSGGTIPAGRTGLVAEDRPEIVNGRLVTEPTLVDGPAEVTGGQATASRLAGRSSSSTSTATSVTTNHYIENHYTTVAAGYRPADVDDLQRRQRKRAGR